MKASVSVVSYNRKALLEVSLLSIMATMPKEGDWELVVVDNDSRDGTQEYLMKLEDMFHALIPQIDVKFHFNRWNKNLGPATNLAFDLANPAAEWLITYSEDDYLCQGWWENFWRLNDSSADFVYTLLRPAFLAERQPYNICGAHVLLNDDRIKIGCGLAVRHQAIEDMDYRWVERWRGPMGSPYTVFHQEAINFGLKFLELNKPCGVTQNCEFNNPDLKEYYDAFFEHRDTTERLEKLRNQDGYWKTPEDRLLYYKDTGYDYEAGAEANAKPLRKIVENKFNVRLPNIGG